jgi:hypothetical protein
VRGERLAVKDVLRSLRLVDQNPNCPTDVELLGDGPHDRIDAIEEVGVEPEIGPGHNPVAPGGEAGLLGQVLGRKISVVQLAYVEA